MPNTQKWLVAVALLGLVACRPAAPAGTSEQPSAARPASADWPWPASMDPLTAAPGNHRVLFENDRVRVLDVTIRPGEREPVHAHRWPSVLYVERAGDFIDRDKDGAVLVDSRKLPPITYPTTNWLDPQPPHSVENLSTTETVHLVRVELKQ